jgi:Domain of unknown function (DUF4389)
MSTDAGASRTPTVTIDFPQRRSRLTTLFRFVLALPLYIFGYVYAILAFLAAIVTWLVMIFTARYPKGLYAFVSGYLRFYMRFVAYLYVLVDAYPPFGGGEAPGYPVQVTIPERKERYSRLKAFFRFIYVLPMAILIYVLVIVFVVLDVIGWISILITARMPHFIERYAQFALGWFIKFYGLYFLLTENY